MLLLISIIIQAMAVKFAFHHLQVMEMLMSLSSDYWEKFINVEEETTYAREPMTPETRPGGLTDKCPAHLCLHLKRVP